MKLRLKSVVLVVFVAILWIGLSIAGANWGQVMSYLGAPEKTQHAVPTSPEINSVETTVPTRPRR